MNPTDTEHSLDEIIAREFDLDSRYVYLNHAGVAPWPRCAAHAVRQFAIENTRSGPVFYDRWLQVEQELRQQFRQLLNAPSPADIALVKNTSEALSFVAYGLHWRAGDNIVSTDQEFPSNRIVWESLLQRHGVEFRSATLDMASEQPEEALISRVDKRTRLITVSAVFCSALMRFKALAQYRLMSSVSMPILSRPMAINGCLDPKVSVCFTFVSLCVSNWNHASMAGI